MSQIVTDYSCLEVLKSSTYKSNIKHIEKFHSHRFSGGETFLHDEAPLYLDKNKRYVTYLVKKLVNDEILAYFSLSAGTIF